MWIIEKIRRITKCLSLDVTKYIFEFFDISNLIIKEPMFLLDLLPIELIKVTN